VHNLLSSLGAVSSVIGAQWGDEGKGKVTDILAEHYDIVARACGGANAGHTIVIEGEKYVFHLLPSGCLHEDTDIVLGAGMVLHLPTLLEEIETLKEHGIDVIERLYISPEAHILFNYHKDIDGALEEMRNAEKGQGIGTTKRGIGPAYMDKAERTGIRMELLSQNIRGELEARTKRVKEWYGVEIDIAKELSDLADAEKILKPRIVDVIDRMHSSLSQGKTILIEGAQATLLDIDHGTYPFVTSSSTTIAGALQGVGIPPKALTSCIGVAKAYCTRVGSGPFLTEMEEEQADRIRNKGGEFGATTGRPRRCGWLHIPDLLRAAQLNGFTHWNITKLDVLDDEAEILIGTDSISDAEAKYTTLPGWQESTVGLTSYSDLPENAKKYIQFIEEQTGVPVGLIGTGQGREEMIVKS
jgi:adenylosuccinate synthase